MSELCIFQVFDKENSPSWGPKVYRNCKRKAGADGFCGLHSPDAIAERFEKEAINDVMDHIRTIRKQEEAMVGLFLRMFRPNEFAEVLGEANRAADIAEKAIKFPARG